MLTLDLKRELHAFYKPSAKQPEIVEVPTLPCLMIDGVGDPNTAQDFQDAMAALNGVAYTLKFALKRRGLVYPVMPTEGLWWIDNMADFLAAPKSDWKWTLLIVQPEAVTEADFAQACTEVGRKKQLAAVEKLRLESFAEGLAAQIMHIGSYEAEAPTIERLHRFIEEQGCALSGKHHEIYLGDPRRSAPEKLKTIIRQPIRRRS